MLEYPGQPSFFLRFFCHCLQLAPIKTIMPSFSSTAPAFVFAAERFCPNYFSLPLLHQQYNTICRRSHFRFQNLFIIVSKSYPLTFNFPYQLLLQKLIFNLFSLFSFLQVSFHHHDFLQLDHQKKCYLVCIINKVAAL